MRVEIDENSGFCFGVTSAINKAEEILKAGTLYCLGDIVHNEQEVQRLERRGLITVNHSQFGELRNASVLFRAHGEPPCTYKIAQENHLTVVDASCPVVLHLQKKIQQTYAEHPSAQIVIFGKRGHAEVIGLQGQTCDEAIVVESEKDLENLDFQRDIYLFSQTTMSGDAFEKLERVIRARHSPSCVFEAYNTICKSVSKRREQLQDFARQYDCVFFVGGEKSSNAKVLYQYCLATNAHSFFISTVEDIEPQMLENVVATSTVGVCGATSTPFWLMQECKKKIEELWNIKLKR